MTTQNIFDLVDTWNDGATTFTAVKMNVTDSASNASSLLMDLLVGSVSAFNVSKGGSLKLGLNASGTNVAASAVTISAPRGTGNAAGGSIIFQVAPAGGSGPALNALVTAWSISGAGHILAGADNTYDIGATSSGRPANVYANSIWSNGGGNLGFYGRAAFTAPTGGNDLTLNNASYNGFGKLNFGGTSASFPALKRSTTVLQTVLASDTGFATIQGKLRADVNAVAETPTATHTITITDAAGTAYKVLCVAA